VLILVQVSRLVPALPAKTEPTAPKKTGENNNKLHNNTFMAIGFGSGQK
jgi:hypothetical protein